MTFLLPKQEYLALVDSNGVLGYNRVIYFKTWKRAQKSRPYYDVYPK